jgi:hypothetical protein
VLRKKVPHGWWESADRQGMASAMPEGNTKCRFAFRR